jgi:hypothetical protein
MSFEMTIAVFVAVCNECETLRHSSMLVPSPFSTCTAESDHLDGMRDGGTGRGYVVTYDLLSSNSTQSNHNPSFFQKI